MPERVENGDLYMCPFIIGINTKGILSVAFLF
jgi:hypothetical protein